MIAPYAHDPRVARADVPHIRAERVPLGHGARGHPEPPPTFDDIRIERTVLALTVPTARRGRVNSRSLVRAAL